MLLYLPWHMVRTRQFSWDVLWMFFMFRSNTVCLNEYWLIRVKAECHYVNLLIFLTIIGPLLCVRHIWYTFIKKLAQYWLRILFYGNMFFPINFTIFSICFYYALNILTTLYRMGSWNATRTYPVQCWHDMKVNLFVRSESYTQVCDQDFCRAGKVS